MFLMTVIFLLPLSAFALSFAPPIPIHLVITNLINKVTLVTVVAFVGLLLINVSYSLLFLRQRDSSNHLMRDALYRTLFSTFLITILVTYLFLILAFALR